MQQLGEARHKRHAPQVCLFENLEFANLLNTEITKDDLLEISNSVSLKNIFVSERYVDEETLKLFKDNAKNIKFNVNEFLIESEEV